jgi:hypothetical protein
MSEGEMKPLNLSNEERAELRMHLLSRKDMLIRSGIVAVGFGMASCRLR